MLKRNEPVTGFFPVFVWGALALLLIGLHHPKARATEPEAKSPRRYIISVDTLVRENQTPAWSQGLCSWVHQAITELSPTSPHSKCFSFAVDEEAKKKVHALSIVGNYHYRLHLVERTDGSLDVQFMNWRPDRKESEFNQVGWTIHPEKPEIQSRMLYKLLRNIVTFDLNEKTIREFSLIGGIQESSTVRMDENGVYYDAETKSILSFEEAFARFENESSRTRNFLRASTEVAVVLGLGALIYHSGNTLGGREDLDVHGTYFETIKKKLTDANNTRFDSNDKTMNVGHAFAGALYYHAIRTGGFNSFESFLMAVASSTLWEYLSEFHEKVSINDQVITPVGGAAIGETLYQFGDFFIRGGDTTANKVLTGIFGSIQKFHYWLDGQKLPRAKNLDKYGFNADVMHQFDIWTGINHMNAKGTNAGTGGSLGWDMIIFKAPGYGKEGKGQAFLKDTVMSQFMVNLVIGKSGLQEFETLMKSVFTGFHKQDIRKNAKDQLDGYSFTIGLGSAYDIRSLPTKDEMEMDWHAVVNVLGTNVEVVAFRNGYKLRMTLDVYGDFAMVRSLAYDDYVEGGNSTAGMKTILTDKANGYYFGLGMTTAGTLTLSRGNWEVGVEGKFRQYDSIEGMDRYQEQVTKDFDHKDRIGSLKLKFSHPFFFKNAKMTYSAERITHESDMGSNSRTQRYNQVMGRLVFTF